MFLSLQACVRRENISLPKVWDFLTSAKKDKLIITEDCNEIDLSWYLYEFVALEIPMTHSHPEGECNSEMENLLKQYSGVKEDTADGEPVDSRWSELKKLIDNN